MTFLTEPSRRIQATFWPLLQGALVDADQREPAEERRGVEVGDVGLQRRALGVDGAGMVSRIVLNSGSRSVPSGMVPFSGCTRLAMPARPEA